MADDAGAFEERFMIHFDANMSKIFEKLSGLNKAAHSSAAKIEKEFNGINLGKALDKVFDESKFNLINAGGTHIRVFGAALEPLGALGIGAAAGITALYLAMNQVEKAAEFADEISHVSAKLGISAEAVQHYDYVWAQSGIGIDKGRAALERLNEIFGQAQAGLLRPQSLKAFQALGFTQKQLLSFKTAGDFMAALIPKLSAVGNAAERAGIAERLGIVELIPLLHAGAGGWDDLAAKTRAYQVMSNASVAKMAELNGELQSSKLRIKEAGLALGESFAPTLISINNLLANTISLLAKLYHAPEVLDGSVHAEVADMSDAAVARARAAKIRRGGWSAVSEGVPLMNAWSKPGLELEAKKQDAVADAANARAANSMRQTIAANRAADVAEANREKEGQAKIDIPPTAKKPRREHEPKAPKDDFAQKQASALGGIDDAARAYLEALEGLTKNTAAHAALEKQAIAEELEKSKDATAAKIAKVQTDKGLTAAQKAQLVSELQSAQITRQLAADDREALVDRETKAALAKQAVDQANAGLQNQVDMLKAESAVAKTKEQRQAIALQILALEEQIYDSTQRQAIAAANAEGDTATATRLGTELAGRQASYGAREKAITTKDQSPGEKYVSGLQTATGSGLGDSVEQIAVTTLKSFNEQLTEAIVNGKNFGQVLTSAFRQVESSLINLALEKYLTLPLAQAMGLAGGSGGLSSFFGGSPTVSTPVSSFDSIIQSASGVALGGLMAFANGTDFAPGGAALVGENGPEIVNLPKGSSVLPNGALGGVGVTGGMSAASPSISFDLRGAVMTADLVSQMQDIANKSEARATQNGAAFGLAAARQVIPTEMARRQSLQIR